MRGLQFLAPIKAILDNFSRANQLWAMFKSNTEGSIMVLLIGIAIGWFVHRQYGGRWKTRSFLLTSASCFIALMVVGWIGYENSSNTEPTIDAQAVQFEFGNDPKYIDHLGEGETERKVGFVRLIAQRRLKCARAYLTDIKPITDNELAPLIPVDPLRSQQHLGISWFDAGVSAFQCRPISNNDTFALFNIWVKKSRLDIITDTYAAEADKEIHDIHSNRYRITIIMDDDTLPHGSSIDFTMTWDRATGEFRMEPIPSKS